MFLFTAAYLRLCVSGVGPTSVTYKTDSSGKIITNDKGDPVTEAPPVSDGKSLNVYMKELLIFFLRMFLYQTESFCDIF